MADVQKTNPGYRVAYNVNPGLEASNVTDKDNNPTGGSVQLVVNSDKNHSALEIVWQNGPRGTDETNADGSPVLLPPNGAFVEDVLWAALQRLEFFQHSNYKCRANAMAITHIEQALQALKDRQLERSHRNVEGKHEV